MDIDKWFGLRDSLEEEKNNQRGRDCASLSMRISLFSSSQVSGSH
jgi:hypothetical protein